MKGTVRVSVIDVSLWSL